MDKDINLGYLFKLKPEAAVNYLSQKGYKVTNDWRELWEDAHAKAFTVAKMTDMQLLKDTKMTLEQGLSEGWSAQKTQRELKNMFKVKGWWGKQEITDEEGNTKTVQLGSPYRVRTIYKQNIQSAYNAGRYLKQLENVDFAPYLQYLCILDERTRPTHQALHEKVFRYDDPIWASIYPPNGWGCRCFVRSITAAEVSQKGLKIQSSGNDLSTKNIVINEETGETKQVAVFNTRNKNGKLISMETDAGWSSNVGKAAWNIDVNSFNAVQDMSDVIKAKFISDMAQNINKKRSYENFVKNTLSAASDKGIEKTCGWIHQEVFKNTDFKNPVVAVDDKTLRFIHKNTNISNSELLLFNDIIRSPDNVYEYKNNLYFLKALPFQNKYLCIIVKKSGEKANFITGAQKATLDVFKKGYKKIK